MKNKVVEMARLITDEFNQEFYSKLVAITLHNAGYRKQGDTVREFSDKIRAAVDNITDTHSFTQPNLCVEVYVNKTAVLDCLIKLTNRYRVGGTDNDDTETVIKNEEKL